jgi:hypothetical protein
VGGIRPVTGPAHGPRLSGGTRTVNRELEEKGQVPYLLQLRGGDRRPTQQTDSLSDDLRQAIATISNVTRGAH